MYCAMEPTQGIIETGWGKRAHHCYLQGVLPPRHTVDLLINTVQISIWEYISTDTHTHTHTQKEKKRTYQYSRFHILEK